ncbi:MAG: hypothetical protein ACTSVD_01780 [Candidatus Thorarchaeota archaeon]
MPVEQKSARSAAPTVDSLDARRIASIPCGPGASIAFVVLVTSPISVRAVEATPMVSVVSLQFM